MLTVAMRGAIAALLCGAVGAEPFVLLMKSVARTEAVYGESLEVQLRLFNKGDAPAFGLAIADTDWSTSKFELVKGKKEMTMDMLGANENVTHTYTLRPVFSGKHVPVPATVSYAAAKGGASVTHISNAPPQMLVLSRGQKYLNWALSVGRVLSLNFVRTARGWVMVTLSWMGLFGLVGLFKLQQKMRVWRHERAIAEMEKMK
mmetsp:Transcript_10664/g.27706  ORF Transcript_10664/g.27706 Transcript_10664/m.27706 type:complete len:203 (+) Transcript_10664:24-632(+)